MITGSTYSPAQLQETLKKIFAEVQDIFERVGENQINTHPGPGGWSVAQVVDHLTKSNRSIVRAIKLEGSSITRDPAERVNELRDIFLDFGKKFESPDFIRPTESALKKVDVITEYRRSCQDIMDEAMRTDVSEMINHPAFGDITKLEILHFVLFHTLRHNRQIGNIIKSFNKN